MTSRKFPGEVMELIDATPRPQLAQHLSDRGMSWYQGPAEPTWMEDKVYVFTPAEIRALRSGAAEICRMIPDAVHHIVSDHRLLDRLGIPDDLRPYLFDSWERRDPGFYGRIDFSFDPERSPHPAFFELNADTAACLHEALVVQPDWWANHGSRLFPTNRTLTGPMFPRFSHWGDVAGAFRRALRETPLRGGHILFLSVRNNDERMKGALAIQPLAEAAGYSTSYANIEDVQFRGGRAFDLAGHEALTLFKVYGPWEKLMLTSFARELAKDKVDCIEPIWKVLVQNKLLPVILWQLNEGHPNLIPAYFEDDPKARLIGHNFVRKPIFGREGNNIEIFRGNTCVEGTSGGYGQAGWIRQSIAELPEFRGRHPMTGIFVVQGEPAGLLIRESPGLITLNESPVIPHVIRHET